MADVTGAITETINGTAYRLRLTMGGIARLQERHGQTIAGLLDGTAGDVPRFMALIDLVAEALQKGSGLKEAEATDLADELLTADITAATRIISAAFPNAEQDTAGNGKGPKAAA